MEIHNLFTKQLENPPFYCFQCFYSWKNWNWETFHPTRGRSRLPAFEKCLCVGSCPTSVVKKVPLLSSHLMCRVFTEVNFYYQYCTDTDNNNNNNKYNAYLLPGKHFSYTAQYSIVHSIIFLLFFFANFLWTLIVVWLCRIIIYR
jgi:hypothetical protein